LSENKKNPKARKDNLLVEEVGGELLIYDVTSDRAHCLNESAAAIWRHCNGTRSPETLASHLFPKLAASEAKRVVAVGIERLRRRRLIEGSMALMPATDLSKRELLKKVAILAAAAGVVAPLIKTVVAPTPAYAFSCVPLGGSCTSIFGQCCNSLPCIGGLCGG
jgi:Coenzyme PQQ synthesis protein D (PqqD)